MNRDFPGNPEIKTPPFHKAGDMGLILGRGTNLPHAVWCGPPPPQKKNPKNHNAVITSSKLAVIEIYISIYYRLRCVACRLLVTWPGIKSTPSAVKVPSPNHWTTKEFLKDVLKPKSGQLLSCYETYVANCLRKTWQLNLLHRLWE